MLCLGGAFAPGPHISPLNDLVLAQLPTLVSSEGKGYAECLKVFFQEGDEGKTLKDETYRHGRHFESTQMARVSIVRNYFVTGVQWLEDLQYLAQGPAHSWPSMRFLL